MPEPQTVEVDSAGKALGLLVGQLYDVVMDFALGLTDTKLVVQDAAGKALANTPVWVWLDSEDESCARQFTTDASGVVHVDDLEKGSKLCVRVLARGTAHAQPTATTAETKLVIQDASGCVLPNTRVRVWKKGDDESTARTLTSDASGAIVVEGFPSDAQLNIRIFARGTPKTQ